MKSLFVLVLISVSCIAQSAKPSRLSDSFSKVALRALLAIKTEDCNSRQIVANVDLLINEASVQAKSRTEMKVVDDLNTVQALNVVNSTMRGLTRRSLEAQATLRGQRTGVPESAQDSYQNDLSVISSSKQDRTCQDALESSLRQRVYSPLPAICTGTK